MQNPLINALLSFNRHVMLSFYLTHIKKETIINLLAVNVLILSLYLLYWLAEKSYNILLPPPRYFPVEQRRDLWIQVLHANGPSRTESRSGGYHPTHVGDPFEAGRCYAIRKLGGGSFSTVWFAVDKDQSRSTVSTHKSNSENRDTLL